MSCPSTIDGVANDSTGFAEMESLTQQDLVLLAKICLVELNSLETMVSQVKEVKPMEKAVEEGEESEKPDLPGQLLFPLQTLHQ